MPPKDKGKGKVGGSRAQPAAAGPSSEAEPVLSTPHSSALIPLTLRPNFGTLGRPVTLAANWFALLARPPMVLRFQVDIEPPPRAAPRGGGPVAAEKDLPPALCRDLLADVAKKLLWGTRWAYDGGHILWGAAQLLPGDRPEAETAFIVKRDARKPGAPQEEFNVKIRSLGPFRADDALRAFFSTPGAPMPADASAVLDAVTRHAKALDPLWAVVGRSVLSSRHSQPLSGGLELWRGYSCSARPGGGGGGAAPLSLVVNAAAAAFVAAQPALKLAAAALNTLELTPGGAPLSPSKTSIVHKALRGLKVELRFTDGSGKTIRRAMRAKGVTKLGADECLFDNDELGKKESVADYFKRHHKVTLKYPSLPCVDASTSPAKPRWLPLELCHVLVGQRRALVDDPRASADIIKATALAPLTRKALIEAAVAQHIMSDPTAASFGLRVSPAMASLQGRVLDCPVILYGANQSVAVKVPGSWQMGGARVLKTGDAPNAWTAVCLDARDAPKLEAFRRHFADGVRSVSGVALSEAAFKRPPPPPARGARGGSRESLEDTLARSVAALKASAPPVLALVVLDGDPSSYGLVKTFLDAAGVVSQCLMPKNLSSSRGFRGGQGGGGQGGGGPDPTTVSNLALKVNAKLGGVSNSIKAAPGAAAIAGVSEKPTMLFGADVTHPAPGSSARSVAGVVGSLDGFGGRFAARLSAQPGGKEIITDLDVIAAELLREFEKEAKTKPERVVFFRDGVSEGQYQAVMRDEVPLLRKAFASLGDGPDPKLTFVIVAKRHHTRLFPTRDQDKDKRSGNVLAGTVVDTVICHPHEFDFYLVAHAGIQGTSRPVHYHVLIDENGYGADVMQQMCFKLSHTYCRCTRSVSLVAPVYYAHLACSRGRVLRPDNSFGGSTASGVSSSDRVGLHAALNNSMFFV